MNRTYAKQIIELAERIKRIERDLEAIDHLLEALDVSIADDYWAVDIEPGRLRPLLREQKADLERELEALHLPPEAM